jgi:hypothetical protein
MADLVIGRIVGTKSTFACQPDALRAHTLLIGQSRSGKSCLLCRLLEELALSRAGSIVLLDFNFEFSSFGTVNAKPFGNADWNKNLGSRDTLRGFTAEWHPIAADVTTMLAENIRIPLADLSEASVALLLGIDRTVNADVFRIVTALFGMPGIRDRMAKRKEFEALPSLLQRWSEGRYRADDTACFGRIPKMVGSAEAVSLARLANEAESLANSRFVLFANEMTPAGAHVLDKRAVGEIGSHAFASVDLLGFPPEDRTTRDFLCLRILREAWRAATDEFRAHKRKNGPAPKARFIVIDEAHNLAPVSPERSTGVAEELAAMLRTVAAEGRKFGLFLLLVTQRPDKLDPRVISECTNLVLMRASRDIPEKLARILPFDSATSEELKKLLIAEYPPGRAACWGQMTDQKIVQSDASIPRTCSFD